MMSPIRRILESEINGYSKETFQEFCDRVLVKLFPNDFTPARAGSKRGDDKNDGYCPKNKRYFQVYGPESEKKAADFIKKIKADLAGCIELHPEMVEWTFITNKSLLGQVHTELESLRSSNKQLIISTWERKVLVENILCQLDDSSITELLGFDPRTALAELAEKDLGIIDEIISGIVENEMETEDDLDQDARFIALGKKIDLNFPESQRKDVTEMCEGTWDRQQLVSDFLKRDAEESDRVMNLEIKIKSDYRKSAGAASSGERVQSLRVFEEMAKNYLPREKTENPDYFAASLAIILHFFELCFIGAKEEKNELHQ